MEVRKQFLYCTVFSTVLSSLMINGLSGVVVPTDDQLLCGVVGGALMGLGMGLVFTQGGTTGGVTAASAIAALQEAGSKLSRDMLKSAYRAFSRQCYLMVELMRQFYDEQRIFRIVGPSGENQFLPFSAAALRPQPVREVGGVELGSREPIFDIVVSAAKKSTFSRLSQNETAKECYQLGFFAPANADAALAALEMMDFEGIEKVRQRVRQNGTLAQQLARMQAQMAQLTGLLEVQKKSKAPKLSGPAQELSTAAMARAMKTQKGEMR